MTWVVASLLVAQAAAAPRTEAPGVEASVHADKPHAEIGEPFTLTIEARHAATDTVSLPEPLNLGDLTVRAAPTVSRQIEAGGSRAVTRITVPVVNLKTLKPRVPELALRVDGPDGARQTMTKALTLQLTSLVEPEDKPAPKTKGPMPPKQPVSIPVRSFLWASVLFGIAALAALLYAAAVLGRRARERRRLANVPKPLSIDEVALRRIMVLKHCAPWNRGQGRAAIFELSEIVRDYLGKRLGFDAIDLTSDELLTELRKRRILGLDLAELTEELSWENLVKFAKLEPTAAECEAALVRAAELIERMKPLAAPLPPLPKPAARELRA